MEYRWFSPHGLGGSIEPQLPVSRHSWHSKLKSEFGGTYSLGRFFFCGSEVHVGRHALGPGWGLVAPTRLRCDTNDDVVRDLAGRFGTRRSVSNSRNGRARPAEMEGCTFRQIQGSLSSRLDVQRQHRSTCSKVRHLLQHKGRNCFWPRGAASASYYLPTHAAQIRQCELHRRSYGSRSILLFAPRDQRALPDHPLGISVR